MGFHLDDEGKGYWKKEESDAVPEALVEEEPEEVEEKPKRKRGRR